MMNFLNRLTVLQRSIEPKLLETLEIFSQRFGADMLMLEIGALKESAINPQRLCYGGELLDKQLHNAIVLFVQDLDTDIPQLYKADEFFATLGVEQAQLQHLAIVPLRIADGEQAVIVLGFISPQMQLHERVTELGLELLNSCNQQQLKHALSLQLERQSFISNFAKLLVEVQDCKQLNYLMDNVLKPFVGFTDCAIFLLDSHKGLMQNLFFDSETHLQLFPFKQSLAIATMPVDDTIDAGGFAIDEKPPLDFEKLTERKEVLPYLRFPENRKQADVLFNLYSGREIIGNCILLFQEEDALDEELANTLTMLMDHISAALVKIIALQKVKLHVEEREILQSLSTDITFNRDKSTLLKAINPKLKMLFNYAHQFVVAVNDDELTVSGLLDDGDSVLRFNARYRSVISAKLPISDPVFTKVLLSNDPIIFDLEILASHQQVPEYMVMNMELGIKKIAMASLRVGSRIMGIWAICLLENQTLSPYQLELMRGVSHQLSIAVENIRTGDAAAKKAVEKEFLSQMSSDITGIRKRSDIEHLIKETLKNHLGFSEAVIMTKTADGNYSPFIYFSNSAVRDGLVADELCIKQAYLLERLMGNRVISVFDISQLIDNAAPQQFINQIANGICTKICIKLKKDNHDLGLAFFNFSRAVDRSEDAIDLYNNISFHLSMALNNILDSEEICRRERERELLLSFISEIAAIRKPHQLLTAITTKLKNFLGFRHLAVGTLHEDGETVEVFVSDPDSGSRFHPEFNSICASRPVVKDGVINKILSSEVPLCFDLDELSDQIELPPYLRIDRESGISHVIAMRFFREQLPFGILAFFFDRDPQIGAHKMSLVGGLGHQISIAVANILANQELERRNLEEAGMINLGYELRSVKDLDVLWKILGSRLKEFFRIDNFMVSVLHEDQQQHKGIYCQENSIFSRHADFEPLMADFRTIHTGTFSIILNSDTPVLFDYVRGEDSFEKLGCLDIGPLPGASGTVGLAMKVGQRLMGFLLFEHNDLAWLCKRKHLFESIISQSAIVISNILSNQRIAEQLKEIDIYKQQLEQEKIYLTEEIDKIHNYNEIIGESIVLKDVFKLVSKVSPTDSTVLVLGETGTGKELIARAIHNNSPRKDRPMVKVNCAALPVNLIESELFGHEKGSFTGATERRLGKFELANKGTLFLDEIGEMPIDLQVKLLRALQEKEIERVGGKETIKVDVRIIAATNRNLEKEIAEGRFRSDLFYRLNIFPIELPALRERKQDIGSLALHFIKQFNKNCGRDINSISTKAMESLVSYDWPGNIRELEHLIERSVLLNKGNVLNEIMLPTPLEQITVKAQFEEFTLRTIDENEKDYILKVLRYCRGRIAGNGGAAQILGVPPTTLNSKIKRLGIKREHTSLEYHDGTGLAERVASSNLQKN
jgi:transcriptional regulator with GAF, ATPase, and Fis domain